MWSRPATKRKNPFDIECKQHTHGQKSEARVVDSLDGKQMIGSGAFDPYKSDGIQVTATGTYRIECKATAHKSMSIKYEWLIKIRNEAHSEGQTPILTVSFVDRQGSPIPSGDWVMVPLHVWKELTSG